METVETKSRFTTAATGLGNPPRISTLLRRVDCFSNKNENTPQLTELGVSLRRGAVRSMMRPTRANKPHGYFLGSYRIAIAPELNSSRLTSLKSIRFDSPANNVGPWPASLGWTTISYSSINPSSANARGSLRLPRTVPYPTPA